MKIGALNFARAFIVIGQQRPDVVVVGKPLPVASYVGLIGRILFKIPFIL